MFFLSLVVFQEVGEIVRLTSSNVWPDRRDGVMCLQSFLLNSGVLRLVPRASLGLILQLIIKRGFVISCWSRSLNEFGAGFYNSRECLVKALGNAFCVCAN